jgi:hypothetical protein
LQGPVAVGRDEVDVARVDHDGRRGVAADAEPRHRLSEARGGGHVEVTGETQFDQGATPLDRHREHAWRRPSLRGAGPARAGVVDALVAAGGRSIHDRIKRRQP